MIASACGICAVYADQHGDAELCKLRIAEKGCSAAAAAWEEQLLFIKLDAGTIQKIHKRNAQYLGCVCCL